jgi:hypothetical protein
MSNEATQFQPGQSGNPKGAPKRNWTWSGVLEKALKKRDKETGKTLKELVSAALIREARKGNTLAIKEIMNRMDGMPKQETDITTGGKPLIIFDIDGKTNDNTTDKPAA